MNRRTIYGRIKSSYRLLDRYRFYLFVAVLLTLSFANPLLKLGRLALDDALFSHTILVPFISGYLIWLRRAPLTDPSGRRWPGVMLALAGLGMLIITWAWTDGAGTQRQALTGRILAYWLLLFGTAFILLGSRTIRRHAFPAAFLLFMVPLPPEIVDFVEGVLQRSSAEVAFQFIQLTGTPVFREGLLFRLPRIAIHVAPECSGIHSSLALFITSFVAGHLLLRSPWTKLLLTVVVIPLGIVRNGFRVLVISMLCVHVDTAYINSPLHHQGGPLFFALSLIPFSLILVGLKKAESRTNTP